MNGQDCARSLNGAKDLFSVFRLFLVAVVRGVM